MFTKEMFDQEVFFENGTKRFVRNIVKVEQGNWFHLLTAGGEEYIFPPDKILFVRVSKANSEERKRCKQ